ncbi:MAG: alpha-ketoglutarate-dependent dioxygenase AlkB [Acidimicrobiales bacterium]|nr:alpha-ketoglutarate-dependent dioxygenase AlkB [Acidimicrobiales bacterium]
MEQVHVAWQPSLLGCGKGPAADSSFRSLVRIELDPASWLDYQPGWVHGSDDLLAQLVAGVSWSQRRRWMYDREVDEPRLTARWAAGSPSPLPEALEDMRCLLSLRYGVEFDSLGLNLYRDGGDSVAWHGDRIDPAIAEPVVALVSLGDARRFLVRRRGERGQSRSFALGHGDLLVTGGRFQREWQHSVPKARTTGARVSLAFRHGVGEAALQTP